MKTNCTRYDPNTGKCKLTNSQAECGYDCAGYSYIPDNYDTHWEFFDSLKQNTNTGGKHD